DPPAGTGLCLARIPWLPVRPCVADDPDGVAGRRAQCDEQQKQSKVSAVVLLQQRLAGRRLAPPVALHASNCRDDATGDQAALDVRPCPSGDGPSEQPTDGDNDEG